MCTLLWFQVRFFVGFSADRANVNVSHRVPRWQVVDKIVSVLPEAIDTAVAVVFVLKSQFRISSRFWLGHDRLGYWHVACY